MANIQFNQDIESVKGYGFLPFARNMRKNVCKKISKNVGSKNSRKPFEYATDSLKTVLRKAIQKTAQVTDDLTGNKIADRMTKVSKKLPHNNYVSPEKDSK